MIYYINYIYTHTLYYNICKSDKHIHTEATAEGLLQVATPLERLVELLRWGDGCHGEQLTLKRCTQSINCNILYIIYNNISHV